MPQRAADFKPHSRGIERPARCYAKLNAGSGRDVRAEVFKRLRAVQRERANRRGLVMWHGVRIPAPTSYRDVTPVMQQGMAAQGKDVSKIPAAPIAKAAPQVGPAANVGGGPKGGGRARRRGILQDWHLRHHYHYLAAHRPGLADHDDLGAEEPRPR